MERREKIKLTFDKISKKYDLLNNIISFCQHRKWKKKLIKIILQNKNSYDTTLDLCTGTGEFLKPLSKISKNLYGLDISKEMLAIAKQRINKENIKATLIEGEAENMPFQDNMFDLITVSYGVRNFYDLNKGLLEINRVLKDNGKLYILEIGAIKNPIWRKIFSSYFSYIMPNIANFFCGQKKEYQYLSSSSSKFPSGEDFMKVLKTNSLICKKYYSMIGGAVFIYECSK